MGDNLYKAVHLLARSVPLNADTPQAEHAAQNKDRGGSPESTTGGLANGQKRSALSVARQQAGWLVSSRYAGVLSADEVQLVRFIILYSRYADEPWLEDHLKTLEHAATAAGLTETGNGWVINLSDGPQNSGTEMCVISDELWRKGNLIAMSWAWDCLHKLRPNTPLGHDQRSDAFQVVDAYLWSKCPHWTWAYWSGHIDNGDNAESVSVRSFQTWVTETRPSKRTRHLPEDLLSNHAAWAWNGRQPRVDPKYLKVSAGHAGIKLAVK